MNVILRRIGQDTVLVIFLLLFFGFFSWAGVDSTHDGIMLKPALDVSLGKTLFREVYTQYGALTVFIQAFFTIIFGPYLMSIRVSAVVFYALFGLLLLKIWKPILSGSRLYLAMVIWLSLAPVYVQYFHSWSSIYALFFQCASLIFFRKFVYSGRFIHAVFVGICTFLAFLCRQPVGIFLGCAYVFLFLLHDIQKKNRMKSSGLFFGGILICFLLFFQYLFVTGSIADWWKQSITAGYAWAGVVRGVSVFQVANSLLMPKCVLNFPTCWMWMLIPWLNIVFTVSAVRKQNTYETGLGLAGIFSWMQYYPIPDPGHYFWAASIMTGPALRVAADAVFRAGRVKYILYATLCIISVSYFHTRISSGTQRVLAADRYRESPEFLTGIRLTRDEEAYFGSLQTILQDYFLAAPEATYINHSVDAMISLLDPHFASPHVLFINWSFLYTSVYPEYESVIREYVRTHQTLVFTAEYWKFPGLCIIDAPSNQNPPIRILLSPEDALVYAKTPSAATYPAVCPG